MRIPKKRLREIEAIPDSVIDYSDIPELDAEFWKNAKLVAPLSADAIYMRIDSAVFRWFRKKSRDYEAHINEVLRSYMDSHKRSQTK